MPEIPATWYRAGEAFIQWVQSYRHPVPDAVFALASFLGEEVFFLLFLPVIYWSVQPALGRWLAYALLAGAYVNSTLKYMFLTPRPPEIYWHHVLRPESPGFPSGHAQVGVMVWGTLAAYYRRWPVVLGAVVLIALVAFSRIYNGVHYPHDVLGGLLFGLVGLGVLLKIGPVVAQRANTYPLGRLIVLLSALVLMLLVLHPAQRGQWPAPAAVTTAATAWGMSVGFVLEQRYVRFNVRASFRHRALRTVVGLVVIAGVYVGLRFLTPEGLYTVGRFVRYALIGLLVAWGLPWFFVRVGWAGREM